MKQQISEVMKLQRKLESTVSNVPREGYALNQFGSYDSEDLTAQLISSVQRVRDQNPGDDYVRFLEAGILSRARRFDDAAVRYSKLAQSEGPYSEPSLLLLASLKKAVGDVEGAAIALAHYNDRVVSRRAGALVRKLADI